MKNKFCESITIIEQEVCDNVNTIYLLDKINNRKFTIKSDAMDINKNGFDIITKFLCDDRNRFLNDIPSENREWLEAVSEFCFTSMTYEIKGELIELFEDCYAKIPRDKNSKPTFVFVNLLLHDFSLFEHNEFLDELNKKFGIDTTIYCCEKIDDSLEGDVEMALIVSYVDKIVKNHQTIENENVVIPKFLSKFRR